MYESKILNRQGFLEQLRLSLPQKTSLTTFLYAKSLPIRRKAAQLWFTDSSGVDGTHTHTLTHTASRPEPQSLTQWAAQRALLETLPREIHTHVNTHMGKCACDYTHQDPKATGTVGCTVLFEAPPSDPPGAPDAEAAVPAERVCARSPLRM